MLIIKILPNLLTVLIFSQTEYFSEFLFFKKDKK